MKRKGTKNRPIVTNESGRTAEKQCVGIGRDSSQSRDRIDPAVGPILTTVLTTFVEHLDLEKVVEME